MAKMKSVAQPSGTDDRTYILHQEDWVVWPFCPVKRRNNSLEDKNLGVLIATREHRDACRGQGEFVVYHGYMFDWPRTPDGVKALPTTLYPTIDALLADGWVVD